MTRTRQAEAPTHRKGAVDTLGTQAEGKKEEKQEGEGERVLGARR